MTYKVGSPNSKRYFLKIDKAREYALLHATGERGVPIYSDTGIEIGQVVIWNLKNRTEFVKLPNSLKPPSLRARASRPVFLF